MAFNTLPMIQYTFCPVTKSGTLKCGIRHSIAGETYKYVCGRNCIYLNNKPWSICQHNLIKKNNLK